MKHLIKAVLNECRTIIPKAYLYDAPDGASPDYCAIDISNILDVVTFAKSNSQLVTRPINFNVYTDRADKNFDIIDKLKDKFINNTPKLEFDYIMSVNMIDEDSEKDLELSVEGKEVFHGTLSLAFLYHETIGPISC